MRPSKLVPVPRSQSPPVNSSSPAAPVPREAAALHPGPVAARQLHYPRAHRHRRRIDQFDPDKRLQQAAALGQRARVQEPLRRITELSEQIGVGLEVEHPARGRLDRRPIERRDPQRPGQERRPLHPQRPLDQKRTVAATLGQGRPRPDPRHPRPPLRPARPGIAARHREGRRPVECAARVGERGRGRLVRRVGQCERAVREGQRPLDLDTQNAVVAARMRDGERRPDTHVIRDAGQRVAGPVRRQRPGPGCGPVPALRAGGSSGEVDSARPGALDAKGVSTGGGYRRRQRQRRQGDRHCDRKPRVAPTNPLQAIPH